MADIKSAIAADGSHHAKVWGALREWICVDAARGQRNAERARQRHQLERTNRCSTTGLTECTTGRAGVNGLAALLAGRPLRARRPWHFFRPDGPMPDEVEMRLTIPPEIGPEADVLAELQERVQVVEAAHEAE